MSSCMYNSIAIILPPSPPRRRRIPPFFPRHQYETIDLSLLLLDAILPRLVVLVTVPHRVGRHTCRDHDVTGGGVTEKNAFTIIVSGSATWWSSPRPLLNKSNNKVDIGDMVTVVIDVAHLRRRRQQHWLLFSLVVLPITSHATTYHRTICDRYLCTSYAMLKV
jgi:hypothetical protein